MQDALSLFLALLVAHLVGDFVFQTRDMVEAKARSELGSYLRHGAIHLVAAYLSIALFVPASLTAPRLHVAVLVILVLHLGCDYLKEGTIASSRLPAWLAFLIDQALHVLILALVLATAFADLRLRLVGSWEALALHRMQILWLLVVYLTTVFGGGFLIRMLLNDQAQPPTGERDEAAEESREQELRLGMYIGWLERLLVLSAILAKSPTTAGLIVAAKSVVRFKKVERSDRFAEYFLLGTFLSILMALAGGLLLRWLLWGSLDLE